MSSSPNSSSSSDARASGWRPFQDVRCQVDIVLGTGWISVRECLQLRRHSIIRLAQSAGSDLQVQVNGVAVADGEVVIVDDCTSIRLTGIVQPAGAEVPA